MPSIGCSALSADLGEALKVLGAPKWASQGPLDFPSTAHLLKWLLCRSVLQVMLSLQADDSLILEAVKYTQPDRGTVAPPCVRRHNAGNSGLCCTGAQRRLLLCSSQCPGMGQLAALHSCVRQVQLVPHVSV